MGSRTRRRRQKKLFWILAGAAAGIILFLLCLSIFVNSDVFDPKDPMDSAHYE